MSDALLEKSASPVAEFPFVRMFELSTELPRIPLVLAASWMEIGLAWSTALHAHMHHHMGSHHGDEHDQLIVPEPIEETGEHALFA